MIEINGAVSYVHVTRFALHLIRVALRPTFPLGGKAISAAHSVFLDIINENLSLPPPGTPQRAVPHPTGARNKKYRS